MSQGRILVIDDEENVRKTVRLTLTKAGFDVVEAEDGEKGIAAMRSGDNPLMVDAIFCDIYMPKINGMEAISFFLSQFPSVPVVVITGQPDIQKQTTLFKGGNVVDYLVKPIEAEKLVAVAKKAMGQRKPVDKHRT
ncbi:MAG: two-component system response regulator [Nitrospirae bacterium RIFCSPLOWO2_02_FULL_62_14]|nr:MAG: two-component system response regulator [Nitrospirae bacterium RIFCSPLOWO2_02_FULL_62_14]